ncbi:response regulator [Aporhodopirellula aestuarii]|uniref:Response regulator n=1 Tax=Aporhodopirellula aestuarii TaxID=2950107 RepID=A0ABT0TZL1_9BACT|nr:response regulator [Aporhodopirellula aestuarii]MCM2370052.1 response regulator [Aporhodopirellula aestuarii]
MNPSTNEQTQPAPEADKPKPGGPKVLLVDDDAEIVETVSYALESAGYEVIVARDGNQGLALAERESPSLMILDMMMPKRSGFLVLEKLRRELDLPLPVIMITGNEGSRHQAYAELLGVSEYIRKPFSMDRLLDAVAKLLANPPQTESE